ncbi:hypothetical protein AKJ49_00530 [candidate division MSBL1 archaeon SCGC-AAA382A03]|uniref:Uncharacterized protein n=1 Tax=candidate division MSBL1 archaeon SCGC-AAA382A03 TaxID=1698278 RepID=A0A133VGJ2_9EURY|nr:hypothetical protein AKJ49_00530 [candidate division MSBL1 archaeon SCGC-AAA382A03]
MHAYLFQEYSNWLENRGYIEYEVKKGGGRPTKEPVLTESGKAEFLFGEFRKESKGSGNRVLSFEIDGGTKGTVKISAGKSLNPEQVATLVNFCCSGHSMGLLDPEVQARFFKGKLKHERFLEGVNEKVRWLESEMWEFAVKDALVGTMGMNDHLVRKVFPPPPSVWFPSELNNQFGVQKIEQAYTGFWRKRLGEARQRARSSLEDIVVPPEVSEEELDWNELESDLASWEFEKRVPRRIRRLVEEELECQKWVKKRLEEDPSFFMPSPFWRKMGFEVTPIWNGRVSIPYNTMPSDPKFLRILTPHLLFETDGIAASWKKNQSFTKDLQKGAEPISNYFEEFTQLLKHLQEREEFYSLWTILSQRTLDRKKRRAGVQYKDLEIFKPIREAQVRYKSLKKFQDLSQAYSDLQTGRKSSIEELSQAIENGDYDR